ncbi:hypothetical protein ACRAWF_09370 [Streptomyces sp. L7]
MAGRQAEVVAEARVRAERIACDTERALREHGEIGTTCRRIWISAGAV